MNNLEQRLTKLAEKMADEYSTSVSGPIPIHKVGFEIGFKAGMKSMIPIIVKLAEALKLECSDRCCDLNPCNAKETLKELEDFINKQEW